MPKVRRRGIVPLRCEMTAIMFDFQFNIIFRSLLKETIPFTPRSLDPVMLDDTATSALILSELQWVLSLIHILCMYSTTIVHVGK